MTRTPVARKRPTKTRSKNQRVSSRPALAVSTLRPTALDLSPGHEHLVCPDCDHWTPITGIRSTPRLVPHHTEPAGTPGPLRTCLGTNRRVILDIDATRWQRRFVEGVAETRARRSTKVLPKPVAPPAPAVMHVVPPAPGAEDARKVYDAHHKRCAACTGAVTAHCTDGAQLAATAARLLRQESRRKRVREQTAKQDAAFERHQARMFPERRAAQWDWVRLGVERVDEDREQLPAGGAPTGWDVPREPLGMAYKVLAHLGPDCEPLCDEARWQAHRRGGASMPLAPGLRLVWHADPEVFAVAQADSRIETTITPDTVGQVLAILAHHQA